jgi:uncharacterized membrane protein YhaH (DUF805 family)
VTIWQWYVRRGRISRRTWWLQYALPVAALSVLALLADLALGNSDLQEMATGAAGYGPIVFAVGLLTLPASISGAATRLHDRGLPAWLLLVAFIPILGQIVLFGLTGFVPGDPRPNRYGPPPISLPPTPSGPLYVPPTWT